MACARGIWRMKKIIIADDNKTFLMYLGLLLKRLDFGVMPADNGFDVLKLSRLAEADVIMLDVHMAALDGVAVLRHLKENKETAHIPVIMLSNDASSETIQKCSDLGCFDFLKKPLKVDKLHDTLQRCFFSQRGTTRRYLRVSYTQEVLVIHAGVEYRLYAETLSEGGIYVRKEDPLPVGTQVKVKCGLGERGAVQVKGSVIYTKKSAGDFLALPPGMAIAFEGLGAEEMTKLKNYIEDIMAKDIFESQKEDLFER